MEDFFVSQINKRANKSSISSSGLGITCGAMPGRLSIETSFLLVQGAGHLVVRVLHRHGGLIVWHPWAHAWSPQVQHHAWYMAAAAIKKTGS